MRRIKMKKKAYNKALYELQVELVKFQKSIIDKNEKVCLVLEGRDTAGKDGTIKRFIEHMSPREVRNVALDKPSDREQRALYMQRYIAHLPVGREIVFFNRSWYNRAGVEPVMGYCSEQEHKDFLTGVGDYEQMLIRGGVKLFKYYLDISKGEQKRRLESRKTDPLKQWKLSPNDAKALEMWDAYSKARDEMFTHTNFPFAPWRVVHTDDKKTARINIMRHFLSQVDYPGKREDILIYDPDVVFDYTPKAYKKSLIAE